MSRANRRHHLHRMRRRRKRIAEEVWGVEEFHSCSCQMCRNPRRSNWNKGRNRLTRQELRSELTEREQRAVV